MLNMALTGYSTQTQDQTRYIEADVDLLNSESESLCGVWPLYAAWGPSTSTVLVWWKYHTRDWYCMWPPSDIGLIARNWPRWTELTRRTGECYESGSTPHITDGYRLTSASLKVRDSQKAPVPLPGTDPRASSPQSPL